MLSVGEVELTCDMAETYHLFITDWYDPPFPVSYLANLAAGLGINSRIRRKIDDRKLTLDQMLYAFMVDKLAGLMWQNTKDGHKGRRYPESIYRKLEGLDDKKKDELQAFESKEDFQKWYEEKHK